MDDVQRKTCDICYSEMDVRARKCPCCQHWQNKFNRFATHPIVVMIPFLIAMTVMVAMLSTVPSIMREAFNQGEDFSTHEGEIAISNSKLEFGELESGPTVVILGRMENSGDFSWKDVRLEVEIFDADGNLVDACQDEQYRFVVPAQGSSALKVSFPREFPKEHYVSHKIRVISATDVRAGFL